VVDKDDLALMARRTHPISPPDFCNPERLPCSHRRAGHDNGLGGA
jgi:hypothetical protein